MPSGAVKSSTQRIFRTVSSARGLSIKRSSTNCNIRQPFRKPRGYVLKAPTYTPRGLKGECSAPKKIY